MDAHRQKKREKKPKPRFVRRENPKLTIGIPLIIWGGEPRKTIAGSLVKKKKLNFSNRKGNKFR